MNVGVYCRRSSCPRLCWGCSFSHLIGTLLYARDFSGLSLLLLTRPAVPALLGPGPAFAVLLSVPFHCGWFLRLFLSLHSLGLESCRLSGCFLHRCWVTGTLRVPEEPKSLFSWDSCLLLKDFLCSFHPLGAPWGCGCGSRGGPRVAPRGLGVIYRA